MNTWTKLKNGDWGIRIEGVASPGETIWVSRKNGARCSVIVGQILWTGGGVMLATKGVKTPTMPAMTPVEALESYDENQAEYEANCF